MRVLLDTNVLISALIKDGRPKRLLNALLDERHTLLLFKPIIEEFSKVAADERIRRYVTSDDDILRTAYDGQAALIATGDRHLLELKHFKGITILTVAQALDEIM